MIPLSLVDINYYEYSKMTREARIAYLAFLNTVYEEIVTDSKRSAMITYETDGIDPGGREVLLQIPTPDSFQDPMRRYKADRANFRLSELLYTARRDEPDKEARKLVVELAEKVIEAQSRDSF